MITYEQITAVMQNPSMILCGIMVILISLILYLIFASVIHLRSRDGRKLERTLIKSPATVLVTIIFLFIQSGLLLILFYFPIWAKTFS